MRYNQVTIAGRLVRDAELKYLSSGKPLLKMRLAYDQGTKENRTSGFIDVSLFGPRADAIGKWCTKGRQLLVGGRLEYREWADTDGKNRSGYEIIAFELEFTDSKREEGGADDAEGAPGGAGAATPTW